MDSQAPQLQVFAEGIAKIIQQAPVVLGEIQAIRAETEQRKEAEKAVSTVFCGGFLSHLKFMLA